MKLTNEKLEVMLELQKVFEDKVIAIVKEKYAMENGKTLRFDEVKSIEYENDSVEAVLVFYRNCSCCPDDEAYYTFPKEWLFGENWQETYRLTLAQKRQEAEKEQYEQLKEKFGTKQFLIVYYNRFANQTQSMKIEAVNAFRAGRAFYRQYNRKAYHAFIELIEEI